MSHRRYTFYDSNRTGVAAGHCAWVLVVYGTWIDNHGAVSYCYQGEKEVNMDVLYVGLVAVLIVLLVYQQYALRRQRELLIEERERAKKSLNTSRSVVKGQLAEQMFPLSIECPFALADMKFFGMPIDYIVLDGYSNGDVKEVVFVEIKTGNARLSPIQRSLRDCIDNRRVRWSTVTIKEPGNDRANRGNSSETGASSIAA
jgi:hypothetical protein